MSGLLDFAAGRFQVIKDGRVAFDTDTPAARLAPSKKLTLTDYEIEWPDFYKGIYYTMVNSRDPILGTYLGGATSYLALVGQECGPKEPTGYTLPDIVLGTAPAGANYLNVKVNLVNTVVPGKIAGDVSILSALPAGKWTRLPGSSCRVESHGPLRRTFDILLDGSNIVLRRRQSVRDSDGAIERVFHSYSTSNGQFAYYHPGSPGTNAAYSTGHYAAVGEKLQSRSSGSSSSAIEPGGSSGCTLDTTLVSYRSVWAGDIEITPGRVG